MGPTLLLELVTRLIFSRTVKHIGFNKHDYLLMKGLPLVSRIYNCIAKDVHNLPACQSLQTDH